MAPTPDLPARRRPERRSHSRLGCHQKLRGVYHEPDLAKARRQQPKRSSPRSPPARSPEIARLGRTLRRWADQSLAHFTTGRSNNGPTEAINGLIELHRRIARGYSNPANYRLRMILVGGGLNHPRIR